MHRIATFVHFKITLEITAQCCGMYYCFANFLPSDVDYFALPYLDQVRHFTDYLEFLSKQTDAAPKTNKKQSIAWTSENELPILRTLSGFGAFGTEDSYLNQKNLTIKVAYYCHKIQHTFKVESNRDQPRVLNSRSFMFYWCHAEKQLFMHLLENKKLFNTTIFVDRVVCPDCLAFFRTAAKHDQLNFKVQDPEKVHIFN